MTLTDANGLKIELDDGAFTVTTRTPYPHHARRWVGPGIDRPTDFAMECHIDGEPYWYWYGTLTGTPEGDVTGHHLTPRKVDD
jgi:hypothetical protein